jgi:hypothetical protein
MKVMDLRSEYADEVVCCWVFLYKGSNCSDSLAYCSSNGVRSHAKFQRTARSIRTASLPGRLRSTFILHRLRF